MHLQMSITSPHPRVAAISPRATRTLLALLFLGALFVAPTLLRHRSTYGPRIDADSRQPISPFTVTELNGKPWRLADHRGEVILINYWATWCAPCREELPGLVALTHDNRPANLAILGISLDDGSPQAVRQFVSEHQLPDPVALADKAWQLDQIPTGVPTSILLDRRGRVAKTYTGPVTRQEFQDDISALLREPA